MRSGRAVQLPAHAFERFVVVPPRVSLSLASAQCIEARVAYQDVLVGLAFVNSMQQLWAGSPAPAQAPPRAAEAGPAAGSLSASQPFAAADGGSSSYIAHTPPHPSVVSTSLVLFFPSASIALINDIGKLDSPLVQLLGTDVHIEYTAYAVQNRTRAALSLRAAARNYNNEKDGEWVCAWLPSRA